MKRPKRALVILFLLPVLILSSGVSTLTDRDPGLHDWENPRVFNINKEQPRASFIPFRTVDEALNMKKKQSVFYKSLNGR